MATQLAQIKCRAEPMLGCFSDQPSAEHGSTLQRAAPYNQGRIQWSTSRKANSAIR